MLKYQSIKSKVLLPHQSSPCDEFNLIYILSLSLCRLSGIHHYTHANCMQIAKPSLCKQKQKKKTILVLCFSIMGLGSSRRVPHISTPINLWSFISNLTVKIYLYFHLLKFNLKSQTPNPLTLNLKSQTSYLIFFVFLDNTIPHSLNPIDDGSILEI